MCVREREIKCIYRERKSFDWNVQPTQQERDTQRERARARVENKRVHGETIVIIKWPVSPCLFNPAHTQANTSHSNRKPPRVRVQFSQCTMTVGKKRQAMTNEALLPFLMSSKWHVLGISVRGCFMPSPRRGIARFARPLSLLLVCACVYLSLCLCLVIFISTYKRQARI